jgi:hypothetical protein
VVRFQWFLQRSWSCWSTEGLLKSRAQATRSNPRGDIFDKTAVSESYFCGLQVMTIVNVFFENTAQSDMEHLFASL